MVAVQQHCFNTPFDTPFIYASVDADVRRLILRNGQVVGEAVDTERVGQVIYTKRVGSDSAENLTESYKGEKSKTRFCACEAFQRERDAV